MPVQFPGSVKSQLEDHSLHYRARCWRIELTQVNNRVLRFTDHSEPLTLFDGAVYQTYPPAEGGAFQRQETVGLSTTELSGVISDSGISVTDLRTGILRGAKVIEYLVDTRLAHTAPFDVRMFYVRTVQFEGSNFSFGMESVATDYNAPTGEYWGPMCRVPLFSQGRGKCNLNPDTYLNNVTLTVVSSPYVFRANNANALWDNARFGEDGTAILQSRDNAGFKVYIKRHTIPSVGVSEIELQTPPPYALLPGDVVMLYPGCNKRLGGTSDDANAPGGDCVGKYDNAINFQGEPWSPTADRGKVGVEYS